VKTTFAKDVLLKVKNVRQLLYGEKYISPTDPFPRKGPGTAKYLFINQTENFNILNPSA
jgi:hypothetical protein